MLSSSIPTATEQVLYNRSHLACKAGVWIINESAEIPLSIVKCFVNIRFTSLCHAEQDLQEQNRPKDLFC
jgi:hypothetical protein